MNVIESLTEGENARFSDAIRSIGDGGYIQTFLVDKRLLFRSTLECKVFVLMVEQIITGDFKHLPITAADDFIRSEMSIATNNNLDNPIDDIPTLPLFKAKLVTAQIKSYFQKAYDIMIDSLCGEELGDDVLELPWATSYNISIPDVYGAPVSRTSYGYRLSAKVENNEINMVVEEPIKHTL